MRVLATVALLCIAAAVPMADILFAQPVARKPRKVALLVGPKEYLHGFDPLRYCHKDVTALAAELRAAGFDEVVVLTDGPEGENPATGANVVTRLEKLVAKQPTPSNNVRRGDVVLVALSGHGLEYDVPDPADPKKTRREAFFVPADGKKGKANIGTLVSLSHLVDDILGPCGGRNLLLVDACREIYDPNKGKGVGGQSVSLTGQTAMLFSCSSGEQSWESSDAKIQHGVFTHAVLSVMRETRDRGEELYWSDLVSQTEKRMRSGTVRGLIPEGKTQTPVLAAGQVPATELFSAQAQGPKGGEERDFEITKGVKMRFCWVPAGKAQLGSPKAEQDFITRTEYEGKRPTWLDDENETARGEFTTRGFWLGKYEVMQGEWTAVMGSNPSAFAATGSDEAYRNRVKGLDTTRFPVERVSWDDCQVFLKKVDEFPGRQRGRFVLPHEDEWEYACRGGKGNGRAFYWGDTLNGTEANCAGNYPYGGVVKGPNLERTAEVGSYETKSPHPWGLCDMAGNGYEWCENKYSQSSDRRVLRGGSWGSGARFCRAASRDNLTPDSRRSYVGFRVCFRLD